MLKILKERERIFLFICIFLIICIVGFKVIYEPFLFKNNTLNQEIKETKEKLKKCLLLLSQKDSLLKEYAKISVNIPLISMDDESSNDILLEIENLAKNANIRIVDMRPRLQKNLSSNKESYIELRAEGDMESHLKFLYNIENSLAFLQVKKLQMNAKTNSSELEGNFLILQNG